MVHRIQAHRLSKIADQSISQELFVARLSPLLRHLRKQETTTPDGNSDGINDLGVQEIISAEHIVKEVRQSNRSQQDLTSVIFHLQTAAAHFEVRAVHIHFERANAHRYTIGAEALARAATCHAIIAIIFARSGAYEETLKYAELFKLDFMLYLADSDFSGERSKEEEIIHYGLFLLRLISHLFSSKQAIDVALAEKFLALCLQNDAHFRESFHSRLSTWYPKIL
jgi:hypothetical protein